LHCAKTLSICLYSNTAQSRNFKIDGFYYSYLYNTNANNKSCLCRVLSKIIKISDIYITLILITIFVLSEYDTF
jgi:hypothetical protein